jgi:O-antigen/teichoic acid export membrane protein
MIKNNSSITASQLKTLAVRGAGINIFAQFLGIACQTVGVILLARLLKPKDFGLVTMVTAFSLWFSNFGVNGFTEFIIQKQVLNREDINSIFWLYLILAVFLAIIFTLFGFLLVIFYAEPALIGITVAMSTGIILNALFTCHFALLKRDMKFTSIAIAELTAVILSVVFAIAVAEGGMGYWAIVTRQITIPVVTVIAAWILCPWRPNRPQYLSRAIPGLKYAVRVYGNFSLGFLTKNIDKVLIGKYQGPDLLGNYDRAYHLSSMPGVQLLSPLNSIALATLSYLRHDKINYSAFYISATSIIAYLGALVALVMTLSAQDLVPLLLGSHWTEAGRVVMAFGPGIAAELVYGTCSWLHLSLGTPDRWLRWNLFATTLTIGIFVLTVPFGLVAMATAYSVRTFILVVPALWYAGRPIQLSLGVLLRSIMAYFVSAFVVGALWLFLATYWFPLNRLIMGLSPLNRIVITACSTSLIYLILVIILQRSFRSIREIRSLISLFLSRRKT